MLGKCRLCGKRANIVKSHIIPKFVYAWLKKSSATGFLRPGDNPNKRVQDGPSYPLYCAECEALFSKYENLFAKKIFYPHMVGKCKTIDYLDDVKRFIIGISWRFLDLCMSDFHTLESGVTIPKNNAHEEWRNYLLNRISVCTPGIYLNLLSDSPNAANEQTKLLWYSYRGTDAALFIPSSKGMFVYIQLPKITIIVSVFPAPTGNVVDTQPSSGEMIDLNSPTLRDDFADFVISRVNILNEGNPSEEHLEKVRRTIRKNRGRFKKSETSKYLSEEYLK